MSKNTSRRRRSRIKLINGLEWDKEEIEKQINLIKKNLQLKKERLKRWNKYLKEAKQDEANTK